MNIILIGYRGTGKSTVGRKLADTLNIPFYDTDELIQKRTGRVIKEIVEEGGWGSFREEEKKIIRGLSSVRESVIATGGGAVMDEENLNVLRKKGVFIWLTADVRTIIERMEKDKISDEQRPSLSKDDLYKETANMLEMRMPVYRQLADFTVDTSEKDIDVVADEVCLFSSEFKFQSSKFPTQNSEPRTQNSEPRTRNSKLRR
ncbi:MAG: shikimate kinase [Syntrophales bacterium]|nr:shikimate kinase [Syntrophales bacterium]